VLDAALADGPASERIMVRFGATLVANLVRGGLSFISGILIARGLGASGYGDLNFLLGSFAAISQLLEMGTSSAFYTFISQKRRSRFFMLLYLSWVAVQFVATVLVVGLLLPQIVIERIWVGHEREIVLLAFGASFLMTQAWGMVSQLGEAMRKTVLVQTVSVLQAVAHLALVGGAVYWNWLTVRTVMWLLVAEYTLLAVIFSPKLIRANLSDKREGGGDVETVVSEFATYCKPLVIYAWVGFLYAFADRWLLQQFGGAEQQGFFAVGQQFANIVLVGTVSILKVFWKEIAEAREREDKERIRRLYVQVTRGSYFCAAFVSCFMIPYSKEIVELFLGRFYLGAWPCLAVMLLYPVQQAIGQTQGIFFYASRATGTITKIGISMMLLNIPITYLVLAPPTTSLPGLNLGAVGLAAQMVVMAIVGINLQGYMISRTDGWTFEYAYQALILAPLLALSFSLKWVVSSGFHFFLVPASPILIPIGTLPFYVLGGLSILLLKPELGGMTRGDVRMLRSRLIRWRAWLPAGIV
jgi:O-antigen/teichoic acid export membrane protein